MPRLLVSSLILLLVTTSAVAQTVIGGTLLGGADLNCANGCDINVDKDSDIEITMSDTGLVVGVNETGLMGIIIVGTTFDPCSAAKEGMFFYNATANVPCFCDGTNDLKISDGSACF